ncbi:hypothetical protein FRC03_001198 [Tulasnella sp. 419]|nr:hypothetical protein FRC03_001198 [Tulasnella sp. 419]
MSIVSRPPAGPGLPSSIRPSPRSNLAGPSSSYGGARAAPSSYSTARSRSLGRAEPTNSQQSRHNRNPDNRGRATNVNGSQRRAGLFLEQEELPSRGRRMESSDQSYGERRSKSQHSSRIQQQPPLNIITSSRSGSQAQSTSTSPSTATSVTSLWERGTVTSSTSSVSSVEEPTKETSVFPAEGLSSTFWNSVATATANVRNLVFQQDELQSGLSPHGESELSIAMKKYWIKRVKRPQDLPSWLFNDYERQVDKRQGSSDLEQQGKSTQFRRDKDHHLGNERLPGRDWASNSGSNDEPEAKLSTAATRLRAMADAKRGAPSRRPS